MPETIQIIIIAAAYNFTKAREENGDFITVAFTTIIALLTSVANWVIYYLINH